MKDQKYLQFAIKMISDRVFIQGKEEDETIMKLTIDAINRKIKHQRSKENLTFAFNNEYKVREYIFEILCQVLDHSDQQELIRIESERSYQVFGTENKNKNFDNKDLKKRYTQKSFKPDFEIIEDG